MSLSSVVSRLLAHFFRSSTVNSSKGQFCNALSGMRAISCISCSRDVLSFIRRPLREKNLTDTGAISS